MTITKRISVLLLTAIILVGAVLPVSAAVPENQVEGQAGQRIAVDFEYKDIAGINGTITYSSTKIFSDIKISTTGLTSGSYNPVSGDIFYSGFTPVNCTITLFLTIAESAKIGETCTITIKYETTKDGNFPSVPQYQYDTVTVTVKEIIDYSALELLIAKAELFDIKDYTATSWAFLELALTNARNNLSAQTQSEVNRAYSTLKTAMDALVKNSVYDYDELNKQIIIAESLTKADYTSSTWSVLEKALKNAKSALNVANQKEIDTAAKNLKNAIGALKKISTTSNIDYTALDKQIKMAGDLKEIEFTPESWNVFKEALDDAKVALTSISQAVVDNAAMELRLAIANLVAVNTGSEVSYGELNRLITIAEGYVKTEYTPESWAALEGALINAQNARLSTDQSVVDNAAAALATAISNLQKQLYNIDYSELNKQITIAEGMAQKDYTFTSWTAMLKCLNDARKETSGIDQSAVDAAALALKNAIAGLVSMNYQPLLDAMEAVKTHADSEKLSEYWYEMHELLAKAEELTESGDQEAVDACAKELGELLIKIIDRLTSLKEAQTVIVEKPVPGDPTDDYCNIASHRVWPILFWISLALNIGFAALIVVYYINKRKKNNDNTPLVDYDIGDDA